MIPNLEAIVKNIKEKNILIIIDFGYISGELDYTTQLALAASNIDFGTITLEGELALDCGSIV